MHACIHTYVHTYIATGWKKSSAPLAPLAHACHSRHSRRSRHSKATGTSGTGKAQGEWSELNHWNIDSLARPEQCDCTRERGIEAVRATRASRATRTTRATPHSRCRQKGGVLGDQMALISRGPVPLYYESLYGI